jgi:iron complex outermembrane receptor protein
MSPARRFTWTPSRLLDESAIRGQASMGLFARRVHFQRFRLLGLNGTAPFPMAAFELGLKNRFFGDRLMINTEVFRYRHGGYRLTLPPARGYSGVGAVLPSLGMSSRTTGAEVQAGYRLGPQDYAGLSASYTHARRSSLPSLAVPDRRITSVSSFQVVPSYEHIVPLAHGRSLSFDAAAIYRSSVRVADAALLSPIASFDTSVRKIETTRFEASLTYRSNARFSMTAFVRNITDVRPERATPLTTRNLVNPSTVSAVLSEPRTFGLSLSARL